MAQSRLMEQVRRPVSPDAHIEVPASQEDYEHVRDILEDEGEKYPRLWYDSARGVAIIVGPPSPVHSGMASELVVQICYEVNRLGSNSDLTRGLSTLTDSEMTRATPNGLTIRAWDTALQYIEGNRSTVMIVVELGLSQEYESLRRAISWWVCAWQCRLGLTMSIREGPRRGGRRQAQRFASQQDADASVAATERELRDQLLQRPYGPLVANGVTWFGQVQSVVLETYRTPGEVVTSETLLEPTQTFVSDGSEFIHRL
ncbi:hypothetical protein V1517DRAFT_324015 [Lipomyces orientalis]|uniref:Uncharacterized protein n=1 Tax=Lipomyces orientalis TaxID=1233043 RepID=A0ACC3TM42_9ASCO